MFYESGGAVSDPPVEPKPQFHPPWRILINQYWLWALAGAVFIGVTLPCLLVVLHRLPFGVLENSPAQNPSAKEVLVQALILQIFATLFCGPGALVLAGILYAILKSYWRSKKPSLHAFMCIGMILGAVSAFANFPGYICIELLRHGDPLRGVRVTLLFAVTGATCGSWIAWQAYRSYEPGVSLLPRYSLKTLLGVVLAWGALLAFFTPR